jgi:hypothetical protein
MLVSSQALARAIEDPDSLPALSCSL